MCLNHKSESGCKYGDRCKFLHTEAGGQASGRSKKCGGKGSVAFFERDYSMGLCPMIALRESRFCGK